MAAGIANMFRIPELRKRIFYTLVMLAVYRIGIFVTTPGVDRTLLKESMNQSAQDGGGLMTMMNFFSGGALEQASVFALGIMPYITSSIIMQLMTVVIPALERMQKEGDQGRQKITQYTRYGTVVLATVQGILLANWLKSLNTNQQSVVNAEWGEAFGGIGFIALTVLTLTAGTAFIMWLGERITERGIGNGISLIIFAGIVARLPQAVYQTFDQVRNGDIGAIDVLLLVVMMLTVIAAIVYIERGQRRIPIQYAKRMVDDKQYGGQSTHLPLKVNTAGVIPPIFASSILMFPATAASLIEADWMTSVQAALTPGSWLYNSIFIGMILFFAFFYTAMTFNPVDVADNLKKFGGFVPGIRPGRATAEYIDHVLTRVTFFGAIYLAAVCILPMAIQSMIPNASFYFGGTGLLIVVGVALDTSQQIEGHLISRQYEGFAGDEGPRIKGRTRVSTDPQPIIG